MMLKIVVYNPSFDCYNKGWCKYLLDQLHVFFSCLITISYCFVNVYKTPTPIFKAAAQSCEVALEHFFFLVRLTITEQSFCVSK